MPVAVGSACLLPWRSLVLLPWSVDEVAEGVYSRGVVRIEACTGGEHGGRSKERDELCCALYPEARCAKQRPRHYEGMS